MDSIDELLKILQCPECKSDLEVGDEKKFLTCKKNHKYSLDKNLIDFGTDEQVETNSWSKESLTYEERKAKHFNVPLEKVLKPKEKKLARAALEKISNYISKSSYDFVVDIASGMGAMFTGLCSQNISKTIISTDISRTSVEYLRMLKEDIFPEQSAFFIVCDASNLPFKNSSVDALVSHGGYLNTGDKTIEAYESAKRVLKLDNKLITTGIGLSDETDSYRKLISTVREKYSVFESCLKLSVKSNLNAELTKIFPSMKYDIIGTEIGEGGNEDLVPIEGEEYEFYILELTK